MIPVGMTEDAAFSAGMKVVATGDVFAGLDEDFFKYKVTGYGIGTIVSRSGAMDAWADYENARALTDSNGRIIRCVRASRL